MLLPTNENWNRHKDNGLRFCLGGWPNSNPRFYKYSWQIWTPECGLEGADFFLRGDYMSTAHFVSVFEQMRRKQQPGWIYSRKRPRLGADTPFDINHPKWLDVEFAISWDEDLDPIWQGYK